MAALRRLVAGAAVIGVSTLMAGTAFAAAQQWDSSKKHYSIYSTNPGTTSTYFTAPVGVDRLDTATAVDVVMTSYAQSETPKDEYMRVCYTQPYGTNPIACTDYFPGTNQVLSGDVIGMFEVIDSNGQTNNAAYSNISAKGDFTIDHYFPNGLNSPIYSDSGYDRVTVTYDEY